MRGLSKLVLALSILLVVASCGKKDIPLTNYFFTYKVAIKKKITEPTIINGYYGQMNLYKGNFSEDLGEEGKKPQAANYGILLFEESQKELLEAVVYSKGNTKFYDLSKLKKQDIQPKFEIIPNKSGFYQVDTNGVAYMVLIRLNKRQGYYSGGLGTLKAVTNELINLEMRIDYDAVF